MTDQQHPITPSPEFVYKLAQERVLLNDSTPLPEYIATRAAQWGADQELKECCLLLDSGEHAASYGCHDGDSLRAIRRPKPLSLKKQACAALDTYIYGNPDHDDKQNTYNTIRRALEALPE